MSQTNPANHRTVLAAIVFTDAVGFSALAREDEDRALQVIGSDHETMRGLCAQFEGRTVKSTGDGLLLMFDSAVAAFQCGLEILRTLPESPLRHRIGLHLGDVTESGGDVMGDGVNVASRLQELARPGEMCASQTVVDVVQSRLKFALRPMGEHTLKNIPQPIRVYGVDPFSSERRRAPGYHLLNARVLGYALGTVAVLAIGIPLWMLALRPPAPAPTPGWSGPVTLSPELARYLESDTSAPALETEQTPEQVAFAKKVADLESLQGWFEQQMKAYPKEKPLSLPAKGGAEPTQVWADVSKGVVAKPNGGDQPNKVRAFTFVRATHELIDKMPEGREKAAMLKKLESLAVPRKTAEKASPDPGQPPKSGLGAIRTLPLPKEFQTRIVELDKINLSVGEALKEFGPDKPFKIETQGHPELSLWVDADGELVGATGDGSAAPVEVATYMRVARSVADSLPPGPKRDELLKALDNLGRRHERSKGKP